MDFGGSPQCLPGSVAIPALTGRFISDDERALLALSIRLGGLGIVDRQTVSDSEFAASEKVTSPLVDLGSCYGICRPTVDVSVNY